MSELSVNSLTIDDLLRRLKNREWLIPQFQRDFVWSSAQVISLIDSILKARPIGMATIWEQPDESNLQINPLALPDRDAEGKEFLRPFSDSTVNPKKVYAVLDGLQRCTAIAMAFGGFRSRHGDYKISGRYYLNVAAHDPLEQIIFIKEDIAVTKQLDNDAICIAQGLYPLSSSQEGESMLSQWVRYAQSIKDPAFYANAILPDAGELDRRNAILTEAFQGINNTKLAVYIVPDTYTLADICEIFETLNQTGTKVSTVDLIHSWLYSDTEKDAESILLREWIDELGQKDGAIGWAASDDRPELVVHIVTACYIALEDPKPLPKSLSRGRRKQTVSSVKASDLLATPTDHWKVITKYDTQIAEFLWDFQKTVASGLFPYYDCPYPVTAAIYVALRYHAHLDPSETHPWGIDDLNAMFRAFFWRNALTGRYDQGFLTQLGTDLKEMKSWLTQRQQFQSSSAWAGEVDQWLETLIHKPLPSESDLIGYLSGKRPAGALQKALLLPMIARADKDLIYGGDIRLSYPDNKAGVELHHIFPKAWCNSNKTAQLAEVLDPKQSGKDWVNSISNLLPLSRKSNNIWKAKVPDQLLRERGITYEPVSDILRNAFIDEEACSYLLSGSTHIKEFWQRRAALIATDLIQRMRVVI